MESFHWVTTTMPISGVLDVGIGATTGTAREGESGQDRRYQAFRPSSVGVRTDGV